MSLFSNKQMRIIFIYCVIIILVICGIITARHKKTSSDSIVKTTKTNNETSESSDTQHTSDNTPNTDRLPPYNSSNQGNGIGGGAIMGNCSIGLYTVLTLVKRLILIPPKNMFPYHLTPHGAMKIL